MDEKRRFRRIPFDCPIVLIGKDGKNYEGRVVDISVKGLLADIGGVDRPTEIESFRIELSMGAPGFVIEGEGDIVRESPEGFVGVFFLKIDVESLTHLRRLIELNLGDAEAARTEIDKW